MDRQQKIDEEVEKTLAAIEGLEPASLDDFFYTRLMRRRENRQPSGPESEFVNISVAFSMAAVFLLTIINIWTVFNYTTDEDETTRQQEVESIASEYELTAPLIYEQTNTNEEPE